ncbi:MAG: FAD-dependent oxidoreductase [Acidobacteria bacterium]|nr:FAD-dependent oxidoreductase [Acidobacteriota bacterium]
MSDNLGSETRPLRVAIIGSGPSGFYAAEGLLRSGLRVKVDMFEKLPPPFGLVRYGVAPDHPKIKKVTRVYEKTGKKEGFEYFGNVNIGEDLSVEDLKQHYDAQIYACGAQTDRQLNIPGIDLPGSYTATEFVAWYNGHPEYIDREFDLNQEIAFIIGQGNVAMDVARILAKTVDELKNTDIAQYALEALAKSKVREIHLVGRRGPAQTAFTPPEIKEFGELAACDPVVKPEDLVLNETSRQELEDPKFREKKRNYEILKGYSEGGTHEKPKKFLVHFFRSPIELVGDGKLEKVIFCKNVLVGEPGRQKAKFTDERVEIKGGLFFRSVGYRGVPIEGVPFHDAWGIFPNTDGRIEGAPGFYAVGWIKRGPSGVIGTNKADSIATVKGLLADLPDLIPCPKPDTGAVSEILKTKGVAVVTFADWGKIDAAEIANGKKVGKPREKFVTVKEMLRVIEK